MSTSPCSSVRRLTLAFALALVALGIFARGEERPHRLMFCEYGSGPNRLVELGADGKVAWEHRPPSVVVSFQPLANGNVLYAFGGHPTGAREVNRQGEEVWSYVSQATQVMNCSRLPNGNTLLAEQGPCQATEVSPAGMVVHVTPLTTSFKEPHLQVRGIHQLPDGHILAAHEGESAIREVDRDGRLVWEYTGVGTCDDALRLPNGNTLIACGTQKRIIEVTPDKQIVWQFGPDDAPPELNATWYSSLQLLRNGNLLICNFLRGQEGKGAHCFEVTRDKKVVWKYTDHDLVKSMTTARLIEE